MKTASHVVVCMGLAPKDRLPRSAASSAKILQAVWTDSICPRYLSERFAQNGAELLQKAARSFSLGQIHLIVQTICPRVFFAWKPGLKAYQIPPKESSFPSQNQLCKYRYPLLCAIHLQSEIHALQFRSLLSCVRVA